MYDDINVYVFLKIADIKNIKNKNFDFITQTIGILFYTLKCAGGSKLWVDLQSFSILIICFNSIDEIIWVTKYLHFIFLKQEKT